MILARATLAFTNGGEEATVNMVTIQRITKSPQLRRPTTSSWLLAMVCGRHTLCDKQLPVPERFIYDFPDVQPHDFLDGHVDLYRIIAGLPHGSKAIQLLRTLAAIAKPFMRRYNIRIPRFAELHPHRENLVLGRNDFGVYMGYMGYKPRRLHHGTNTISIRLRNEFDITEFLPLEELVNILCHELAHIWYFRHGLRFHWSWKTNMDEVEQILDCKIKIKREKLTLHPQNGEVVEVGT
jgi:hypothetical protein